MRERLEGIIGTQWKALENNKRSVRNLLLKSDFVPFLRSVSFIVFASLYVPIHPIVRLHFFASKNFFLHLLFAVLSSLSPQFIYFDGCLFVKDFISYSREREKNKRIALKIHLREDDFQSKVPHRSPLYS